MNDHVHFLLSKPPKYAVSDIMGYLKGRSSMMIFERHANLKYKFGGKHFWVSGYYVSTVGLNSAIVEKYIRNQKKADQMEDRLTTKEYVDSLRVAGNQSTWLKQASFKRSVVTKPSGLSAKHPVVCDCITEKHRL